MMKVATFLRVQYGVMGLVCTAAISATGCADGAGAPTTPSLGQATTLSAAADSPRSGEVNITKECSDYHGRSGEHCTITASDLKGIEVGSTITYVDALVFPLLDADIILDPPAPGNNTIGGHCMLDVPSGDGHCRLSGGTGRFSKLEIDVVVSRDAKIDFVYHWKGTYRFDPSN